MARSSTSSSVLSSSAAVAASSSSVRRFRMALYSSLVLFVLLPWSVVLVVQADDASDADYVRQVLEEEQEHSDNANPYDNPYSTDEDFIRYEQEAEKRAQEKEQEQTKLEEEAAKRRVQEREAAFERQVQKLDEESQKKARQKKRRDSKLVSRLLKAAQRQDYYAVLGLDKKHVFGQLIPQWLLRVRPNLGQITATDIKKAYRGMATRVHPDKNHDGRAEEAFVALDEVYSLLSDSQKREEYDRMWETQSQEQWSNRKGNVMMWMQRTQKVVGKTVGVIRKVVGPFALPVTILGVVFL